MRWLSFTLGPEHEGRRVGRLVQTLGGVSNHGYARLKRENGVLLDGKTARADERAHAGQVLSLGMPEETDVPAGCPLTILYQDEDLIVLDKPAPMPVMSSPRQQGPTVEKILSAGGAVFRPVNRLDKGTSGLMVCARNAYMQQRMQRLLHTDDFVRGYLAVTDGTWSGRGVIELPIRRENDSAVRRVAAQDGRPCVTRYETLKNENRRTLVRLRLETGRTHQIRVHMAAIGHPVTGDYLYGKPLPELPGRFALHSAALSFRHPLSGETLCFDSPLPPALSALLDQRA